MVSTGSLISANIFLSSLQSHKCLFSGLCLEVCNYCSQNRFSINMLHISLLFVALLDTSTLLTSPGMGDNPYPCLSPWPLYGPNAEQRCLLGLLPLSVSCLFVCRHSSFFPFLSMNLYHLPIFTFMRYQRGEEIYLGIPHACLTLTWLLLYFLFFISKKSSISEN